MDFSGSEIPDSTSFLGNRKLVPSTSNYDIIEISSDDESDNPEVIEIDTDDVTDSHEKKIKNEVLNQPNDGDIVEISSEDENDNPETFKIHAKPDDGFKNFTENFVTPLRLRNCYVDLHKSEILNCEKYPKSSHQVGNTQTPAASSRLQCHLCQKFYSSKLYLKYHVCAADKGDDKDFNCSYNFRKPQRFYFSGSNINQRHLRCRKSTKHVENEEKVQCKFCNVECKNLRALEYHFVKVHRDQKPYDCKKCGKAFKMKGKLRKHERTHVALGAHERPFACTKCSWAFPRKVQLMSHQNIHTGVKPYPCETCGKAFRLKSNLKTHRSRKRACEIYLRKLNSSMKMKNSDDSDIVKKKQSKISCDDCGRVFRFRAHLRRHLRIHSDARPFGCKVCGKAFKQSSYLYEHVRNVHKVKSVKSAIYVENFET